MDIDDLKAYALVGIIIIFSILAFILPIVICVERGEQRDLNLKKWKCKCNYMENL